MTKMTCPNCGRVGSTSKIIPNGAKVRCARCKTLFVQHVQPVFDEQLDVEAIFSAAANEQVTPIDDLGCEADVVASSNSDIAPIQTTKQCFYCGEDILAVAKKCKHCGEFLDDLFRNVDRPISIRNVNTSYTNKISSKSSVSHPGIAALLSLIIPGAGQMYRGKVGVGIAWLICTTIGYILFIVPGLILHLICIVTAAAGE